MVRQLPHSRFDFFRGIGNSGREQFRAILGDEKHVLEIESLPIHRSDGLKSNGGSGMQRPSYMSGIEVDGVQLPVTNVLSLRPGVNRAPRKITLRRLTITKQLGAPRIENLVGAGTFTQRLDAGLVCGHENIPRLS